MSANAVFVYVLSTIHMLTFLFANSSSISVNGEISSIGHFFVTNAYYQSSLASQTTNAEAVVYVDEHQCRRQCAVSETCQAYLTFTNVLPVLGTCYLYDRDVCVTDPNLLGINANVVGSKLLSKVPGGQEPRPCNTSSDGSMTIATPTETEASTMPYTDNTTIVTTTLPTTVFTDLSNNSAIPEVSTAESVGSTDLTESTAVATVVPFNSTTVVPVVLSDASTDLSNNSAIPEVSTAESVGSTDLTESTTVATVVPFNSTTVVPVVLSDASTDLSNNSAIPEVSTAKSVGSTDLTESIYSTVATVVPFNSTTTIVPPQPRPRTCWEYYTMLNTIDKGDWYLRLVWPSGFSDGTSISVYCRNGYTLILSNYAVINGKYARKNAVTVFGSLTRTIRERNNDIWNAYVSTINFPVLSTLVGISNRKLYYESAGDLKDEFTTYSGLDLAADGTLTIQGSLQEVKGYPPNGFLVPLVNSPFVSSTCGSFWKIPATSTDICTQTTNMLLLSEYQKVNGKDRRLVAVGFK